MSAPILFSPITKHFPQNKPLFLGKGTPGTEITVCQSGNSTKILAKTTVDSNGSWLVQSAVELPEGGYSISAYRTGTTDYAANTPFYVAPLNPILTSPTTVDSLRPLLKGKAAANAIVYVYLQGGGTLFGKPQANQNGDWELQLSQDLRPDTTPLSLAEFSAAGVQVSGWTQVSLTVSG